MGQNTIKIADLRTIGNKILSCDTTGKEYREGVIRLLEEVLLEDKNYNGFSYLYHNEVPLGERPGINEDPNRSGWPHPVMEECFKDVDHTRVRYH